MHLLDRAAMVVARVGLAGKSPLAPGTVGSLAALPLCWVLSRFPLPAACIAAGILVLVGVAASHRAEHLLKSKDPGCIVIDEVAGMTVAMLGLPFTALTAAMGFAVFRILDIFKPFPIRHLEKRVSGGAGIVLDDVAAGVIANLILRTLVAWGLNGA